MCSRTSSRSASFAVAVIRAGETLNGEHGASATRSMEAGDGSWNAATSRSESASTASSSCTTESGGRPQSFSDTVIDPRVGWNRSPTSRAAVISADAPDLPGLLIGKLLQPLTTRVAAAAPATNGGLLGVAARLPVPEWLPDLDLDSASPDDLRAAAPRRAMVAVTPGWHRLRGPDDLRRLDPGLDGWATTRALLGG